MGTLPLPIFPISTKQTLYRSRVSLSMRTVSLNRLPFSTEQNPNINRVSSENLFRKKKTSTNLLFSTDQAFRIFSRGLLLSAKNQKNSGIIQLEKDSVSLTSGLGIINFFNGKKLLITGATGFLAKVLVEKILRSMPEVDKIYLLMKAENEDAAMGRLMNEIIETELFKCLRQKHGPSFERFVLSKLVPVVGNMCETNMGIQEDVANSIARQVDIIIHSAASTEFDGRFDTTVDVNTGGTARIVSFAKTCENLKLYVHVSTAYACRQAEGKIMEESFGKGHYVKSNAETPHEHIHDLDIEAEIRLALQLKQSSKENENGLKIKELGMRRAQKYGWPNTYSFSKAMGEMVVEDTKGQLPLIIIRPTIVESTFAEPFPGWIEGNRMMDPIMFSYGKGKLPGLVSNGNIILDVVPVDIVVNLTLAAIAKHGQKANAPEGYTPGQNENFSDYHVYHIASSVANPLTLQDLFTMAYQYFSLNPCFDKKGNPIQISEFKFFASIENLMSHMEKSTNSAKGNEKLTPRQEVLARKFKEHLTNLINLYQPYSFFKGRFDNTKTEKLMNLLSEEEKNEFGFNVRSIDWNDYIKHVHFPGIRKHVMKEIESPQVQ